MFKKNYLKKQEEIKQSKTQERPSLGNIFANVLANDGFNLNRYEQKVEETYNCSKGEVFSDSTKID
ncbi:MAG: hypothetical protein U9R00_01610 [Patescibacteria group bacterium]|nr:hypothetical protein [Patescibacteria group bacterium]